MPIGESPIKGVSWDPPHCVAGSLEQTWAVRTGPPVRTCPEPTGITQVNQHTSTFPANIYILWLFMRVLLGLKLERTKCFFNWKCNPKWGFSQPPTTQAIFKTTLVPPQNNTKNSFIYNQSLKYSVIVSVAHSMFRGFYTVQYYLSMSSLLQLPLWSWFLRYPLHQEDK